MASSIDRSSSLSRSTISQNRRRRCRLSQSKRKLDDDRATLGISLATTGSSRDTLGVFVMSVDDGGRFLQGGAALGAALAAWVCSSRLLWFG